MAAKRGYKVIRLWESDIKKDSSIILKSLVG
jgi:very-short-patch-repair endonuclease